MLSLLCILRPKSAAPSKVTESVAFLIRDGISGNSSDILSWTLNSCSTTSTMGMIPFSKLA